MPLICQLKNLTEDPVCGISALPQGRKKKKKGEQVVCVCVCGGVWVCVVVCVFTVTEDGHE